MTQKCFALTNMTNNPLHGFIVGAFKEKMKTVLGDTELDEVHMCVAQGRLRGTLLLLLPAPIQLNPTCLDATF